MSVARYPAYKDSGCEWLGEVPTEWGYKRLKHICRVYPSNIDKKSYDEEKGIRLCNYTDVYYNDVITSGLAFMSATATTEQIARFTLKAGDTIVTKDSETADDIAVPAYVPVDLPGVVCGYHLSMLRPLHDTHGGFVRWLFSSQFIKASVRVRANGLTRVGLAQYDLDNLSVPVPPIYEQIAIAAFLDRKTAKIDALIEEQRRLIALLKEKRQAVISRAVTKGLDPSTPMKDSGVEWLGKVPAHWDIVALRRLVDPKRRVTYGIVQPGEMDPAGRFMVRGQDYSSGWALPESIFRVSTAIEEPYKRARLRSGDLVITIVGAGVGNVAMVPDFLDGANITQTTARIAPLLSKTSKKYLSVLLSSEVGRKQVALYQKGAAQPGLNLEHLVAFVFPLPPLEEQSRTLDALDGAFENFDALMGEAESAMSLLLERRLALISAAVTGKIDVRGLAPAEANQA